MKMNNKISAHGQVSLTEASGSFSGLQLDPSGLEGIPPGFNYAGISEMGNFSNLRMRWWYLEGGLQHLVGKHMVMDYALTYQDFRDSQAYLVDTTGTNLGLMVRANWLF
jgi:hypothetical protein